MELNTKFKKMEIRLGNEYKKLTIFLNTIGGMEYSREEIEKAYNELVSDDSWKNIRDTKKEFFDYLEKATNNKALKESV